jgi:hypothetical protein
VCGGGEEVGGVIIDRRRSDRRLKVEVGVEVGSDCGRREEERGWM